MSKTHWAPNNTLKFQCDWFGQYPRQSKEVTSLHFTTDMGYTYEDIGSIMMLEVGDTKAFDGHTVTRTQ